MSRRNVELLRAALAALGAAGALVLTGCDAPQAAPTPRSTAAAAAAIPAAPAPVADGPAPDPAQLERGRQVYNYRCYFCHGYSGDAKTLAASYLAPKPRDFTTAPLAALPRATMLQVVRDGKPGTAMKGFANILPPADIAAVTEFVRHEFMRNKAPNTRYHTRENGWPDHERNRAAFPFAQGEIAIDTPWEQLNAEQQHGKRLFMSTCITCHDHGRVREAGTPWESRPVSYPRDAYCVSCHQEIPKGQPGSKHPQRKATHTFATDDGRVPAHAPRHTGTDSVAAAYLVHDRPPALKDPTALERHGETLFQKNCAFCHAADGTSKGWIGSFLEPHPRDLTDPAVMKAMTADRLKRSIAEGVPETSMPAWRHVLQPREIDALAAYISRAFHPVAGVPRS